MASLDKRKAARRDFPQRGLFFFELRIGVEMAGQGLTQSTQRTQSSQRTQSKELQAHHGRFGSASSWEEDTQPGDNLRPADRLYSNFPLRYRLRQVLFLCC
jgi:hypothetical protein